MTPLPQICCMCKGVYGHKLTLREEDAALGSHGFCPECWPAYEAKCMAELNEQFPGAANVPQSDCENRIINAARPLSGATGENLP